MEQTTDKNRQGQTLGIFLALFTSMLFGFSFLAVKLGVARASALSLLSWRFVLAFLAMSILAALGVFKLGLKGKSIRPLLLLSIFQPALYYAAETYGIARLSTSESGTIIACIPLLTLLLMPTLSKEYPTKRQWISIAVSVAGVILVGATKGLEATFDPLGYLLMLAAALSDAVALNLSRRFSAYSSVEKVYVMTAMGATVFTAGALIEHGLAGTLRDFLLLPAQDTGFLLGCLYLSLGCSVSAFILLNRTVANLGPGRAGSFAGVTTLVGVAAGVLILKESFSLLQGMGTLLVLCGVYGANSLPRAARALAPASVAPQEDGAFTQTQEQP